MRVICINGKHNEPMCDQLKEGEEYEVYQSPTYADSYRVIGYEIAKNGKKANYRKHRFVPISEIDETKLVNVKYLTPELLNKQ